MIYCTICGTKLVEHKLPNGYNGYTGEQEYITVRACPNHPAGNTLRRRPPERWWWSQEPCPSMDDLSWDHTRCRQVIHTDVTETGIYPIRVWEPIP